MQKTQKISLKSICSIRTGMSFRGRLQVSGGGVPFIQLKDIGGTKSLKIEELSRISPKSIKESHRVIRGDIIFRPRGPFLNAVEAQSYNEPIMLAAPLLRLRADTAIILPEYLCWFINQPMSQAYLENGAVGTSIKMAGKALLQDMPIAVPSLQSQKAIMELAELQERESRILQSIRDKRQKLINAHIARYLSI